MGIVKEKSGNDPVEAFQEALDTIAPMVEVKSRRVGGATYQVPVEVRASRRETLSMRWLVEYSRGRGEKSMPARLAGEILDASQGRSQQSILAFPFLNTVFNLFLNSLLNT